MLKDLYTDDDIICIFRNSNLSKTIYISRLVEVLQSAERNYDLPVTGLKCCTNARDVTLDMDKVVIWDRVINNAKVFFTSDINSIKDIIDYLYWLVPGQRESITFLLNKALIGTFNGKSVKGSTYNRIIDLMSNYLPKEVTTLKGDVFKLKVERVGGTACKIMYIDKDSRMLLWYTVRDTMLSWLTNIKSIGNILIKKQGLIEYVPLFTELAYTLYTELVLGEDDISNLMIDKLVDWVVTNYTVL